MSEQSKNMFLLRSEKSGNIIYERDAVRYIIAMF